MGLDKDLSAVGFGLRTERYALVIDDLVVKYVGVSTLKKTYYYKCSTSLKIESKVESGPGVTVAGADAVLANC